MNRTIIYFTLFMVQFSISNAYFEFNIEKAKHSIANKRGNGPYLEYDLNKEKLSMKVYPKNFKKNDRFHLFLIDFNDQAKYYDDFYVDRKGKLISKLNPDLDLTSYQFSLNSHIPGEPFYVVLMSSDFKRYYTLKVIPKPLEAKGSGDRLLSLELGSSDAKFFILNGKGFYPNEKFFIKSQSNQEIASSMLKSDEKGNLKLLLAPAVKGKENGYASVELTSLSENETLYIKYPWGF